MTSSTKLEVHNDMVVIEQDRDVAGNTKNLVKFRNCGFLRYASGQSLYRQADRNNLDPSRERSNNFQVFFRWTACSDTDAGLFTSIG